MRHGARGLGVVEQQTHPVPGDQRLHGLGVGRARLVAVLDRGGKPRRRHHREPRVGQQIAGHALRIADRLPGVGVWPLEMNPAKLAICES